MKKYKIVDKEKFRRFILILLAVTLLSSFMLFNINAKAEENETEVPVTNSGLQRMLDKYSLEYVTVQPGDTFWVLQGERLPNEDIRMLKYYAEFINERSVGELKAWERIYLWVEKVED